MSDIVSSVEENSNLRSLTRDTPSFSLFLNSSLAFLVSRSDKKTFTLNPYSYSSVSPRDFLPWLLSSKNKDISAFFLRPFLMILISSFSIFGRTFTLYPKSGNERRFNPPQYGSTPSSLKLFLYIFFGRHSLLDENSGVRSDI